MFPLYWTGRKKAKQISFSLELWPNQDLPQRLARQFNLNENLFYTDLSKMLDAVKPEAVTAYGSIYEHMMVVEACAPRGIHVMVEKPMATNLAHAVRMDPGKEKPYLSAYKL